MLQNRVIFALSSAAFGLVAGAGLHFIPNSIYTQWITLKDESIWEHIKLFLWPYFIASSVLWGLRTKIDPGFDAFLSRSLGLLAGCVFIPASFFAYTLGDVDNHNLAADIVLFFVTVVIGEVVWYFSRTGETNWKFLFGVALYTLIVSLVILLSYASPGGALFQNPS